MNTSYYNKSEVLDHRWRFSPLDYLTVLLAIVSSGAGIFFLLTYKESISPLRDLTPIAKVGTYNQSPQRKIVGTLTWNGVKSKEVLFRGDQILTDEYSKVEVIFLDKTFLNVPPSSLIKLDFNNGEFDIELVKGFLDINLTKGNEKVTIRKGNQKYQLNSKNGKVQVLSGGKDLKFKTIKGDIDIGGKKPVTNVNKGQLYEIGEPLKKKVFNPLNERYFALNLKPQAAVSKKNLKPPEVVLSRFSDLRKVQRLNIDPKKFEERMNLNLPRPGMYFLGVKEPGASEFKVTPFQVMPYKAPKLLNTSNGKPIEIYEGEKIPLAWTGRKDLAYEVQVKKDGKVKSLKFRGNQTLIPIYKSSNIDYRVRVGSKNAPWSSWQTQKIIVKPGLVVDRKQTPDLFIKKAPKDSLSLALSKSHRSVKGFNFEISKDKKFEKIIKQKKVAKPILKWSNLNPGLYFWRATAIDKDAKKARKTTGPQKLVVKAPAITLKNSYKNKVISTKTRPEVKVGWKEQVPNSKYKIRVFDKENKAVLEKEVTGNSTKIKLPSLGSYSWKVEPLQNKEFLLDSPKINLSVELPPPLESPRIKDKQVIYYRYINGVEAYEIDLPKYKHAEFYFLEVFKDSQLKNLLFKKAFPSNRGYWVSNRSGKYYYRVRVTDKWGRKSRYSKVGTLIFPISPLVKE